MMLILILSGAKDSIKLFPPFFDDALLDRLVMPTNAYAEDKKDMKCSCTDGSS